MRRDEFLRLGALTIGSLLAPPLVHDWTTTADHLDDPDELVVGALRAQTLGYRWLDRQEGARAHLLGAAAHAGRLVERWQSVRTAHPMRSELAELAADACHLVAYQLFDQGRRALASEWYRSSAELAARAGNRDLYVFAASGVAYMQAMQGDSDRSLGILRQTARLQLSPAAVSYLRAYQAHALLAAGDRDGLLRSLDDAATHAERTADEAASPWLGVTGPAWVERQRATLLARLGRPDSIASLTALRKQTPPTYARFHVTVTTDLARAHAACGQPDEAAAWLTTAGRLNRKVRSVERANRMRTIRDRLAPALSPSARAMIHEALRTPT